MLLLLLALASAHDVVVFGDSWAEGSADELAKVLKAHGRGDLTVDGRGVGGTTAAWWNATEPDALADAVSANPDAGWVWLSILGNDTFAHHAARDGALAAGRNEAALREMLDRLFAVHPDVQVVMFGYDYPNFERSTDCLASAIAYFPTFWDAGTLSTANVNDVFLRDIDAVQEKVAADHPNVEHLRVWGTLQLDAGTQGAPTSLLPSPASRMADCIHPTSAGYTALHERQWDLYWGLPAPVVSLDLPEKACRGTSVTARGTATPASVRRWTVDGVDAGDDANLDLALDEGVHAVRLWARNGAWTDAVEATVEVVAPPAAAAVAPTLRTCEGDSVLLGVTGDGTVHWTPEADLDDPTVKAPRATPRATTTYTATLSTAEDCEAHATVEVEVVPLPEVTLHGPDAAVAGEAAHFTVDAPTGATIRWLAGDGVVDAQGAEADVSWSDARPEGAVAVQVEVDGCARTVTWPGRVEAAPDGAGAPGLDPCGCRDTGGARVAWPTLLLLGALRRRRRTRLPG